MGKKTNIILTTIAELIIPVLLSMVGQSRILLSRLQQKGVIGQHVNIAEVKDWCLILAAIYIVIILGGEIIRSRISCMEACEQRDGLLHFYNDTFLDALRSEIKGIPHEIQVRIFVPQSRLHSFLRNKSLKGKYYVIKNVSVLAKLGTTKDLSFRVYPEPQGLVGECYQSKYVVYDCDVKNTTKDYNLDEWQKSKTFDTRFCLCVPIIGDNNKVVSIVSFDSTEKGYIASKDETKLKDFVVKYSRVLYETLQGLFK